SPGDGTFAAGGTVTWFNLNRITVRPVAGAWEYCVYGRTAENMNWIGCGKPQGTGLSTITDLTFDDYGATMMANFVQPGWLPAKPPSSGQADWLSTRIVSGAGTSTLTLANTASTTVSGATIRHDNAPNILAAVAAADRSPGQYFNWLLQFPVSPCKACFYDVNSYLRLPKNLSISFTTGLWLNATIEPQSGALWTGNALPQGYIPTGFSQNGGPYIYVNEGFPGVYGSTYRYTFRQLSFVSAAANGAVDIILDSVQPLTVEDVTISSSTSSTGGMDI